MEILKITYGDSKQIKYILKPDWYHLWMMERGSGKDRKFEATTTKSAENALRLLREKYMIYQEEKVDSLPRNKYTLLFKGIFED